jgi:hypothetical protein
MVKMSCEPEIVKRSYKEFFGDSHLAPRKIDVILSLSINPKVLYLARKAKKNYVAYPCIFLSCTVFYG